jgi:hypothetical protein
MKTGECLFIQWEPVPEGFEPKGYLVNYREDSVNEFSESRNLGGRIIVVIIQLLKNEWRKVNEKVEWEKRPTFSIAEPETLQTF